MGQEGVGHCQHQPLGTGHFHPAPKLGTSRLSSHTCSTVWGLHRNITAAKLLPHDCTHSLPSICRGTASSSTSGPMVLTAAPTAWSTSAAYGKCGERRRSHKDWRHCGDRAGQSQKSHVGRSSTYHSLCPPRDASCPACPSAECPRAVHTLAPHGQQSRANSMILLHSWRGKHRHPTCLYG